MTRQQKTKEDLDMDKRIYELNLKFKMFDHYDKIYNENNYELKNTLEIENKINDLNKKTKHSIILDKTFCVKCHLKKKDHIVIKGKLFKSYYCSDDLNSKYDPYMKKLGEVKV